MDNSAPSPLVCSDARFETTRWSVVQRAGGNSDERTAALENLCATYWPPVYAFIRRRGYGRGDAEDLTQAFLVALMHEGFWQRTDRSQGRFRGYLAGALRMFLYDERERAATWKRGGRAEWVKWDELEQVEREIDQTVTLPISDPAAAFDRCWAQTLVVRAMRRLEEEQRAAGKCAQFQVLQPFLADAPSRGDYELTAATLGTSRTTVAVWMHRLRQRLTELVQLEVAETVTDQTLVKDEMRLVLQALSGSGRSA